MTSENYSPQVGLIVSGSDRMIRFINPVAESWLQFPASLFAGKQPVDALFSPGGKILFQTQLEPSLLLQGELKDVQLDLNTASGVRFPVLMNASRIQKPDGSAEFVYTLFDFRQRKKFEQALIFEKKRAEALAANLTRSNDDLRRFAYTISHDLKAPLGNLLNFSLLLESDTQSNLSDTAVRAVRYISASAESMLAMIDSLLTFYRSGTVYSEHLESVRIDDWMLQLKRFYPDSESGKLVLDVPEVSLHINKEVVLQILLNLISNAFRYSDKPLTIVKISVQPYDDHFRFTVSDNGRGISEGDQGKLFQLFKTLGKPDRTGANGTGIGLATVKKAVESAGGKIHLTSQLGIGTEISVELPQPVFQSPETGRSI